MWLTWRSFGLSYITHFLLFSNVLCQFEQTTWVDQAGQHVYTSVPNAQVTETVTAPASAPTMVYNCAWMPAICNNVRRIEGAGFQSRTLVYDKSGLRGNERRDSTCPDTNTPGRPIPWKQYHTCPEGNQPGVISKQGGPSRPGPIALADPTRPRTVSDAYEIAAPNPPLQPGQQTSGLRYSCDEYPPNAFIQGGVGLPGTQGRFSTYCAPISHCAKQNSYSSSGEQNWQGSTHSILRGSLPAAAGLYSFVFKLDNDPSTALAAHVEFARDNAGFVTGIYPDTLRRSLEQPEGSTDLVQSHRQSFVKGVHASSGKIVHYEVVNEEGRQVWHKIKMGEKRANLPSISAGASANNSSNASMSFGSSPNDIPPQQNFDKNSAPVPIIELSAFYILGQSSSNVTIMPTGNNHSFIPQFTPNKSSSLNSLHKRAPNPIQCDVGQPCLDGSCCNTDKKCGYGENHCGKNCTSNCDATAMCGRDSQGGDRKCGLNLCCSYYGWCGTEAIHCINSDAEHQTAPCQQGAGGCEIVPPPKCSKDSGTASGGRKVAYYQAANVRSRACNRVTPSQIKTDGLTHLFFAFAVIDPASFQITPSNSEDVSLYNEFTALKTSSLHTWIAVGGWDFSNPGPTRSTWSDLVSTQSNRAAFISSLVDFMQKYNFEGVDIDWEYPAADTRGGRPDDTKNLVSLVKEIRAAFGTKYGLSMTLAPDYWYLRGFDPKAMESSVDFFGFMSYDLHGFWDADVKTLGSVIRPQTDLNDIDKDLLPLWFAGVDPAKVNLGLAYYGRGYTVSDPSCPYVGCKFSGPSKAGPCTNFDGVLSLREIQTIIAKTGVQPQLISNSTVKELIYNNDQWIGYDDEETIALKVEYANSACLGGTMIWSIDFGSGAGSGDKPDGGGGSGVTSGLGNHDGPVVYSTDGTCGPKNRGTFCSANSDAYNGVCCSSGGFCGNGANYCGTGCLSGCDGNEVVAFGSNNSVSGDIVYIDPSIWTKNPADIACEPPCVLVLPPWPLSSAETISASFLTTSWFVTETITRVTTQGGATITASSVTQIPTSTVLSETAITLSSIDFSAIYIQSGQSGFTTFTPNPSVTIAPIVITYDVPSITAPTSSTSSSSGVLPVFWGTASGGKHTRTFYPPHIRIPTPPALPTLPWHPGPPLPPSLSNCGPPPGGRSNNNNDEGGCQGADCGSRGCEGSGCNSDNTGSCQGPNCSGGQDQGSAQQNNQEPDNNDEEESQACLAAPIIEEQPAGNGNGNGNGGGGGGGGGGNSPNSSPSSSPSPAPGTSTMIIIRTTTLPPLPPTPQSTVTIITVVTAPTPSTTTPPPPPEATCTAVSKIQNVEIGIWTNYVTDNGATLQDQANKKCLGAHLSKWSVQDSSKSYTAADGTAWVSNQLFQFTLDITHPQQVACLKEAIVAAGGPSNTPKCDFAPLLNPPKRRGR